MTDTAHAIEQIPVMPPPLGQRIRSDAGELARLVWPIILSRSGVMSMALVDTIMVGQHGSLDLAYLSMGLAPFAPLMVSGIGIATATGTQVVTAMTHGEGRLRDCGAVWRRGAPFAFTVGLLGMIICAFGEQGLLATGQSADIAREGGRVLSILGLGLPFVLFYIASNFFLEGIKRPLPGLCFMAAANVVNVLLNWLLIGGHAGLPALGAEGSAWATTTTRIALAISVFAYIWWLKDHDDLGVRRRLQDGWSSWARQRKIGYAGGLTAGSTALGYGILGIMVGRLGPLALGAHAILFNMMMFTAMISIALSAATSVRVGYFQGARHYARSRIAVLSGVLFATAVIGTLGGLLSLFPDAVAHIYTHDESLIGYVAPMISLLAVVVVVNGNRIVMNGSLRGRGETWPMVACNATAFLFVMVPLAWTLMFGEGMGLRGAYFAILGGSATAFVLLTVRFFWLARRDPEDAPLANARQN